VAGVTYPGGAALVDTGIGGPPDLIRDWEVVNVTAAGVLAGLGLVPGDIDLVINTHLHFDLCGVIARLDAMLAQDGPQPRQLGVHPAEFAG